MMAIQAMTGVQTGSTDAAAVGRPARHEGYLMHHS